MQMSALFWLVAAALFEVGGDAMIRKGVRGGGFVFILAGFCTLGFYGIFVNRISWDFSRLLGVYVALFALASVLYGRFYFKEDVPASTWVGLGIVVVGAAVIQLGPHLHR